MYYTATQQKHGKTDTIILPTDDRERAALIAGEVFKIDPDAVELQEHDGEPTLPSGDDIHHAKTFGWY